MLDTAEIADDRRQRRRDDRLIERRQQRDEKQRRENQTHTLLPLDHNRLAHTCDRGRRAHTRHRDRPLIRPILRATKARGGETDAVPRASESRRFEPSPPIAKKRLLTAGRVLSAGRRRRECLGLP